MDGHTHVDPSVPAGPQHFVDQIAQVLGEDSELDPLFLEESWTLGIPAATRKWQQRQGAHADREQQSQSFRDLHNLGSIHFVEASDSADFIPQALASAVQRGYGANASQEVAPPTHRQPSQSHTAPTEGPDPTCAPLRPMTPHHACRLLGVAANSTQEQLKSAYRCMVSQWHPDRLSRATDEARHHATDRMSAINEAYRLLRAHPQPA
jgi:DnaJ-domain-containing protein 1